MTDLCCHQFWTTTRLYGPKSSFHAPFSLHSITRLSSHPLPESKLVAKALRCTKETSKVPVLEKMKASCWCSTVGGETQIWPGMMEH